MSPTFSQNFFSKTKFKTKFWGLGRGSGQVKKSEKKKFLFLSKL